MAKVLHKLDETHSLYQYTDGFSFGTDAVLLSAFIRCRKGDVGVEVGTGTGIIPLLLSIHKEFRKLYALEIQKDYVLLARENVEWNGFSEKVEVVEGDLKEAAKLGICRALVTVHNDNPASIRVAMKNGGELEKVTDARHLIWVDCGKEEENDDPIPYAK